jgi:hypothetical protein
MFEVISIALMLPALVMNVVLGVVTWSAVRRARPEDVPRVLEIYARMVRRRGGNVVGGNTSAEGGTDADQETPPSLP